jgi:UDP-glucose 4-epimerase
VKLEGARIAVTGGTGSLGQVLIRRILGGDLGMPSKVVVLSRDEAKQHQMRLAYLNRGAATDEAIFENFQRMLEFRVGDVRNYDDVCAALRGVDIVINAAALKQVPTCEYFPHQAILTNCIGAYNIVRAISEHSLPIDTVVGVSTDKACKPVNAMGMTKALQERIFISANISLPDTRFICVRYGNVMASRGSVIPLFHQQIAAGGPVTVTDESMTRFLLSIDDAVDVVFAALTGAKRGEIYVPNAPAATIVNVAKALIGDRGIELVVTGVRPGEKMHEIMVSEEERRRVVQRGDYYAMLPMLPELREEGEPATAGLDGEFSSENSVISLKETAELLRSKDLMPGGRGLGVAGELLG